MSIDASTAINNPYLEKAICALNAGLCSIPPKMDGTKAPYPSSWKDYQQNKPSISSLENWYSNGLTGAGLVTGKVSGNLECLDFDSKEIWKGYKEIAREYGAINLLSRVANGYGEESPNGYHILYRCDLIEGNNKLAQGEDRKTLIETRGEGGFIIIAPTAPPVNPSGTYVLKSGGFHTIATITPDERDTLHSLARMLDEQVRQVYQPAIHSVSDGVRPGDDYNSRTSWNELMEPLGWTLVFESNGEEHWRRPGKTTGISATTNYKNSDLLYVFSTSTEFDSERGYSRFSAYTLLNHNGDFKKAAKELSDRGYGSTQSSNSSKISRDEEQSVWHAPEPLQTFNIVGNDYPIDALGSILKPAAKALHDYIQAPEAMCGQSLLAAASMMVQPYYNVIAPHGTIIPLSIFALTVGSSSDRKTPVDNVAMLPIRNKEQELAADYDALYKEYRNEMEAYEEARKAAISRVRALAKEKKRSVEKEDISKALADTGDEPKIPPHPYLIAEDPTIEGMFRSYREGHPSQGCFTDEGGALVGGHAMNADNLLKTISKLSAIWNGGSLDRTRAGEERGKLYNRRLALHWMFQPEVARELFSHNMIENQGFFPRCLLAMPESMAGNRKYTDKDVTKHPAVIQYEKRAAQLLDISRWPRDPFNPDQLAPSPLHLTDEARDAYIAIHEEYERNQQSGEKYEYMKFFAGKLAEHVLRIAGVLAVFDGVISSSTPVINSDYIERGRKLAEYSMDEWIMMKERACIPVEIQNAELILDWVADHGYRFIHGSQLLQTGPNPVRKREKRDKAIHVLIQTRWLREIEGGMEIDGTFRRNVWEVYQFAEN